MEGQISLYQYLLISIAVIPRLPLSLSNEDYMIYFEQLDEPVRPVSFQNKYDLNDGEYVKVTFKGGIKETHPMKIGEVIDVEVMNGAD
ncbi:hypothetical protein [Oceanobacillus neutriphilus]|nr:hypothetical protein [Oceanobacillus neutriphilus]